jgi:dCMP deaminase
MRLPWDDLWLDIAQQVGQRSPCSRAQYGAVIVSADNRVLSVGYNGPPAGLEKESWQMCITFCERAKNAAMYGESSTDPNYLDCPSIHAEMNALLRADNLWNEKAPTLYVNAVTCHRCSLTIANSGIRRVVMARNESEEKRDPDGTQETLKRFGLEVTMIEKSWQTA